MQLRHSTLVAISGVIWLAIGIFLLTLGLNLLTGTLVSVEKNYPLLSILNGFIGSHEQSVILLVAVSLAIGYFKGRYVLAKSAHRVVTRIQTFPNPTSVGNLYSIPYYLLIVGMMGLGMLIKVFGVPSDIRGFVDVAIGAALINGAMIYFRMVLALRKPTVEQP